MKIPNTLICIICVFILIGVILFLYTTRSVELFQDNGVNIIIGFLSYPRNGIDTPKLFERTLQSLVEKQIKVNKLKIIVVGDDYSTMHEQLVHVLNKYNKNNKNNYEYELYDINKNDALRSKDVPKKVVWMHACTRGVIYLMEKAMEYSKNYDYLMISSDDDLYINNTIDTYSEYIIKYNKPDLVYALGLYLNYKTLPQSYDSENLMNNSPTAADTIASGVLYSLKNKNFMEDIIQFRKSRWRFVESCIQSKDYSGVEPEDLEVWNFLKPKFTSHEYTSLLAVSYTHLRAHETG
jgi:hypothetical protein